ncbi:hypothetical protein MYOV003v1_p0213 [Vibrio phage 207E48.1]|nr:hypothetical protein MYOV003v1_p0213 [Vibrio phage 207E48.1]
MADDMNKILTDIKAARERRASEEEIKGLAARVDQAANASVSATEMANGLAKNFSKNMASMIPGKSAITAAITANNPVLAGAAQLFTDMRRTQNEAEMAAKTDRQGMLGELQGELGKLQEGTAEEASTPQPEPTYEPVSEKLVELKEKLKFDELLQVGYDQLQVLNAMYKEWTGTDHDIIQAMERQAEESATLARIARETQQAEEDAYAEAKLRAAAEGTSPSPVNGNGGVIPEADETDTSNFGALGGLIGGLGGLSTMAASMLEPLKGVLKMFRVGPLALIAAAWDFGEGFLNASEILGKDDVQITDRIQAGVANIMGGIGQLGDWIAGLFGFETDIKSFLTNNTIDLTQPLVDGLNKITGFLDQMWDGITPDTNIVDIPSMVWSNVGKMTENALKAVMDYDWGNAADEVGNTIGKFWDYTLDKMKGLFDFFGSDDDEDKVPKAPKRVSGYTYGVTTQSPFETNGSGYPQMKSPRAGSQRVKDMKDTNKAELEFTNNQKKIKEEQEAGAAARQAKMESVVMTTMQNTTNNNTTVASKGVHTFNPRKSTFSVLD